MADGKIKISELDEALQLSDNAEFPYTQDNGGVPTTFKAPANQIARKVAEGSTFTNLTTTAKTLVGAINELKSLGSSILLGTTSPTAQQGADGNIYIQYTEGTGGNPDTVDSIYAKIDGAWCEISTGGGSGTTDYEDLSNKPKVNSVELVGNKSLDDLGIMPASLSKTVSGSIAHITDGADNIPVKSLVSEIVAVESGSGEKSPTNPYTISGFDSGIVKVNSHSTVVETLTQEYVNANGIIAQSTPSNPYNCVIAKVIQGEQYTYSVNGVATTISSMAFFDKYPSLNTQSYNSSRLLNQNATFTAPITGFVFIRGNMTYDEVNQMVASGTSTYYEQGNNYTFTFGQTVYGGHFDNKGNLVVTHGYIASYNGETINEPWISSMDEYEPNTSPSAGAQVVYPLNTPITLAITSQDIPTLLGENNIFSNTGDVEVNYYTDNADEIVEVAKATASTPLHNYSTNEQVVGTWIDGSTVCEKTFDLESDVSISYNSWTETSISWQTLNVNRLVGAEGFTSSGGTFAGTLLASKKSTGNIEIQTPRNGTATGVRYLTIRYTKSV